MHESFRPAVRPLRPSFDDFVSRAGELFCPVQIEARQAVRERFSASVNVACLGDLQLITVSSPQIVVRRGGADVANARHAPYLIKFQQRGQALFTQRGKSMQLRTGDFVVCSTAEPYCLEFLGDYEMPVLVVPRLAMRRLCTRADDLLGRRMPGTEADCRLIAAFVAQIASAGSTLTGSYSVHVGESLGILLSGVLNRHTARRALPRDRMTLLADVKAHIEARLQDRHLGAESIALAFGVCKRTIHKLFEDEEQSLGRYIMHRRVETIRRCLERAGSERRSLTEMALQTGFYDLSHMTRTFRHVYGTSPSRVLEEAHHACRAAGGATHQTLGVTQEESLS